MAQCAASNCENQATERIVGGGGGRPTVEWAVCAFHGQVADADGFVLSTDGRTLILDVPNLIGWELSESGYGQSVFSLLLGYGDVETKRVDMKMPEQQALDLHAFLSR